MDIRRHKWEISVNRKRGACISGILWDVKTLRLSCILYHVSHSSLLQQNRDSKEESKNNGLFVVSLILTLHRTFMIKPRYDSVGIQQESNWIRIIYIASYIYMYLKRLFSVKLLTRYEVLCFKLKFNLLVIGATHIIISPWLLRLL